MTLRNRLTLVGIAFALAVWSYSFFPVTRSSTQRRTLRSEIPSDVTGDRRDAARELDAFNNFAWELFVALNWPARGGAANGARKIGEDLPDLKDPNRKVVWETFPDAATFMNPQTGTPPAVGGRFHQVISNHPDEKAVLIGGPSLDTQAGSEWPLIDQEGNYAVAEIRVNNLMKNYIMGNKINTPEGLKQFPRPVKFDDGSIEVKAAWRVFPRSWLTDPDKQKIMARYYVTKRTIVVGAAQDQGGRGFVIEDAPVGLVGLHLIIKTRSQPDWIWTTFEQVDNYQIDARTNPPAGLNPTFNDGQSQIGDVGNNRQPLLASGQPPPHSVYFWNRPKNKLGLDDPEGEYTPSAGYLTSGSPYVTPAQYAKTQAQLCPNEVGMTPEKVNDEWQESLPAPWKYYKLVVSQWNTKNGPQPRNKQGIAIARNSIMETYLLGDQSLANQVPAIDILNTGTPPVPPAPPPPASTLWQTIIATVNAANYRPGGLDTTGPNTWSSCLLCHQMSHYVYYDKLSPGTDKKVVPKVVRTDYSFLFRTYFPKQ